MDRQLASTFRGFANVRSVERVVTPRGQTQSRQAAYPHDTAAYPWNVDFWGPAWVPKEGATIKLTPRNVDLYSRVIRAYEDHELKVKLSTGEILIDGEVRTEYTFEMDYYFMVGDNRYNSHDSRFWGFVPVSHIVGKPLFVLFNSEDGFGWRWERAFMGIN
jgi:signal peptidase I